MKANSRIQCLCGAHCKPHNYYIHCYTNVHRTYASKIDDERKAKKILQYTCVCGAILLEKELFREHCVSMDHFSYVISSVAQNKLIDDEKQREEEKRKDEQKKREEGHKKREEQKKTRCNQSSARFHPRAWTAS